MPLYISIDDGQEELFTEFDDTEKLVTTVGSLVIEALLRVGTDADLIVKMVEMTQEQFDAMSEA